MEDQNEIVSHFHTLKYLIPVPWVIMTSIVSITEYNNFITECNCDYNINNKPNYERNPLCFIATFTELFIVVGTISLSCAVIINLSILTKNKLITYYNNFEL